MIDKLLDDIASQFNANAQASKYIHDVHATPSSDTERSFKKES